MITRRCALLAVLACLLPAAPAVRGADVERPNILFIMVDDLGKDWISCYGADNVQTPRIDELARTGMLFHNAYSMPQCTPTRVTLLTGQYPWRTGWVNHWDVPRWGVGYFDWECYTTFAELLRGAGYATAIAGKWQINDFRLVPDALDKHGFDDWCVWTGYEAMNPPSANRYWDPYIHTREGSKTYKGQFGPDLYCQFLIDFMKRHRDRPMALYYAMALTHGPLTTTPLDPDASTNREKHAAMVRYTDHLVGRLLDALEQFGLRRRTVVIFTTDNGTSGGQLGTIRGQRPSGGKASKYEGGVCEPFLVSCPGLVPEGVETDALTDFTDLLPTFCELAGAEIPAGLQLDGVSIAPLLRGEAKDSPREWIMALGHGAARLDAKGVRGVHDYADRVIRDKRFKVWVEPTKEISAIYDLTEDPLEQHNLLGADDPEVRAALRKFQTVVDMTPDRDARPCYRKRAPQPWDKTFQAETERSTPRERQGRRAGKRTKPQG